MLISVVETDIYLARAVKIMNETEREALITHIASNPLAGDLIKGSGGLRKMRMPLEGRGKRGGGRVIYWFHTENRPIVLLFAFAKNEVSDLKPDQLKTLVKYVDNLKLEFGA
jgi:hypothetical protein